MSSLARRDVKNPFHSFRFFCLISLPWLLLIMTPAPISASGKAVTSSRGLVTSRTNNGTQYPGSTHINQAVNITCIDARSTTPRPQPSPPCFISAPGYKGRLTKDQTITTSGAGTVTPDV